MLQPKLVEGHHLQVHWLIGGNDLCSFSFHFTTQGHGSARRLGVGKQAIPYQYALQYALCLLMFRLLGFFCFFLTFCPSFRRFFLLVLTQADMCSSLKLHNTQLKASQEAQHMTSKQPLGSNLVKTANGSTTVCTLSKQPCKALISKNNKAISMFHTIIDKLFKKKHDTCY